MPDQNNAHLENLVKVVASQIIERPLDLIWKEISEIKVLIENRDRHLLDDLTIRMKPVVGEFKDKAVEEAKVNARGDILRAFNIDMNIPEHVEKAQITWAFIKWVVSIKKYIIIGAILYILLFIAVASGHGQQFLTEFGKFFLGISQ